MRQGCADTKKDGDWTPRSLRYFKKYVSAAAAGVTAAAAAGEERRHTSGRAGEVRQGLSFFNYMHSCFNYMHPYFVI
jgi:hypothetical protein